MTQLIYKVKIKILRIMLVFFPQGTYLSLHLRFTHLYHTKIIIKIIHSLNHCVKTIYAKKNKKSFNLESVNHSYTSNKLMVYHEDAYS